MGNTPSTWSNKTAVDYLSFLTELFGEPYILVEKHDGMAIWTQQVLVNKTLFGKVICFEKIILRDENNKPELPLILIMKIPIPPNKFNELIKITPDVGVGPGIIWVRCPDLDIGIATCKVIMDFANGKSGVGEQSKSLASITDTIKKSPNTNARVEIVKSLYTDLCTGMMKLLTSGKEHLASRATDPRFIPFNSLVNYKVDSDVVGIEKPNLQKINYPKYTDLISGS